MWLLETNMPFVRLAVAAIFSFKWVLRWIKFALIDKFLGLSVIIFSIFISWKRLTSRYALLVLIDHFDGFPRIFSADLDFWFSPRDLCHCWCACLLRLRHLERHLAPAELSASTLQSGRWRYNVWVLHDQYSGCTVQWAVRTHQVALLTGALVEAARLIQGWLKLIEVRGLDRSQ